MLQAVSISQPVMSTLEGEGFVGSVLSVFAGACNLVSDQGEVVAPVSQRVGNGPLNIVLEGLLAALQVGDRQEITAGAAAPAGLGPGLTPAGDGFLLGLMAALRTWPQFLAGRGLSAEEACQTIYGAAAGRTNLLSMALLQSAREGMFGEAWHFPHYGHSSVYTGSGVAVSLMGMGRIVWMIARSSLMAPASFGSSAASSAFCAARR